MYEFCPYFTNDGSVGLFSPKEDDIYHSTYGALSEAYEKFILPADFEKFFKTNNNIKILDICYGIGYNSKSFLNYFYEILSKKIAAVNSSIDSIDTNNIFYKIYIKKIYTNKKLIFLSPFIKIKKNILDLNLKKINIPRVEKFLQKNSIGNKKQYKYNKFINLILLRKIIKAHPEIFDDKELVEILTDSKYSQYIDSNMLSLFKHYKNKRYKNTSIFNLSTFLHNIYYKYISKSYKKALKYLKINDLSIDFIVDDTRNALKNDLIKYDYVFLDAFTPSKCPCLWTKDFFDLLYKHLSDDGMILTYSNSAAVRNAFMQAGFFVGKIYNKDYDKFIGTIAAKKLEKIKTSLSEYDLGLINSKAGIVYRDENLKLDNFQIKANRAKAVETSNLMSSSKFIKNFRGVNNV